MTESLKELAAEEAVIDLLAGRVLDAKKSVRARMQVALEAAAESHGVEKIAASLPSGETVATIGIRKGETGPVVTDADAFARWVRVTFPDEEWTTTRIVREVKPWKAAELLAAMEAVGLSPAARGEEPKAAQWPHPETGEIHEVPGVIVKPTRARTHALTWAKTGKAAIGEAWRKGDFAHHLAALTAGPEASA